MEIEIWGSEMCPLCDAMANECRRRGLEVTKVIYDETIADDSVPRDKRLDIQVSYMGQDIPAFPVCWYDGNSYSKGEFLEVLAELDGKGV